MSPYSCVAIAGKSAIGIPKIIAFTSTSMKPSTTGCVRTYRKPSAIERRLGRTASASGSIAGSATMLASPTTNVTRSNAYVAVSPIVPMRIPASAGPPTDANEPEMLSSTSAAVSLSGADEPRRDRAHAADAEAEERRGEEREDEARPLRGLGTAAFTRRPTPVTAIPTCVQRSSRRRSTASASAPPSSVSVTSGTSSTNESAATASVEPVSS